MGLHGGQKRGGLKLRGSVQQYFKTQWIFYVCINPKESVPFLWI